MGDIKDIFKHTDCISEEMLMKYVSDKLSPAEKHEVEKHLIDCDMCSDAVEGLQMIADKKKISGITSALNEKIQSRVEKKETKIIFLQQYRTQLAVAASIVLIVGLVWFFRSNVFMKELDPASSEKIFADKFEPYQSDKDKENQSNNNAPVTEAPALNNVQAESPVVAGNTQSVTMHLQATKDKNDLSTEGESVEDISQPEDVEAPKQYNITADANQVNSPVPAEPKPKLTVNTESFALENQKKNEVKEKSVAPAKEITTTSNSVGTGTSMWEWQKDSNSRDLKEVAEKQEVLKDAELKSKSEKERSKERWTGKGFATKQSLGASQPAQSPAPTTFSSDVVVKGTVAVLDSTSSNLKSTDDEVAMKKYEGKDYVGAAEDFEKELEQDPDNYKALFYSAVSYLSTDQPDKAIINLNKVLQKKDGEFYDSAQWYLSLAYIKKRDTKNARKNLMELKGNSKSKYQKQADETLKEMQK